MGKKSNKDNKIKNATVDIDGDINMNKEKYDKKAMNEPVDDDSPNAPDALRNMMKQYKDINDALKNDESLDKENMKQDADKADATKYSNLNGGVFDLDEAPTAGETALGMLTLCVLVVGVVAVAKLGFIGISKARKFL